MNDKLLLLQKQCRTYLFLAEEHPHYKKQAEKCLYTARQLWHNEKKKREEETIEYKEVA